MFLLQYLVLLLSLKKSVIKTVYKTEFVSLIIHSLDMKLSLTAEKARESSGIMSESVSRKSNYYFSGDNIYRSFAINESSSHACSITIPVSSAKKRFNDKNRNVILQQANTKCTTSR